MPNLIGRCAAASRFSIEAWPFARPMTAPGNRYSIAFGHFLTIHASESSLAEGAPPKGGLLAMAKSITLRSHEYRDKFSGTRRRVLTRSACGSVVVRRAAAGFTGWLRRLALAQYSRLVFSVLDGLRAGGSCVGTRRPRNFQGLWNARGATRPLGRDAGDWLCRHFRDVADMAVLNNAHE
jgi:hypothetical protein